MLKASGFLCLLIGAFAATVHAQESVLKGPTCEACTISVTHVVTLGDNDRGLVGPQFVGLRDARGRYWISHPQSGDEVVVFDARGRYVHTFGRAGEGPGEFRRIRQMALGGDDVYLFDPRLARATVVSPDFELKRTVKVVGDPQNVEVLPSGKMVINTSVPTRERAGFMLHLLDTEGEIERSFAEVDSVFRLDYGLVGRRQLAMASEPGQVWVLPATEYVIQKWTTAGRMVEQLRRRVDWFEPHDLEIMPHPETPPAPVIWGVEEDSSGLLTVIVSRADAQWHEAVEPDESSIGGFTWTDDWDRFFDTVIEVIDPVSKEVLASRRVDEFYWVGLGGGHYASYKEGDDGTPQIHVWRVQFTRPG